MVLDEGEAATLPCAAVTAWNAITGDEAGVRRETPSSRGGSGGVSLLALPFAEAFARG